VKVEEYYKILMKRRPDLYNEESPVPEFNPKVFYSFISKCSSYLRNQELNVHEETLVAFTEEGNFPLANACAHSSVPWTSEDLMKSYIPLLEDIEQEEFLAQTELYEGTILPEHHHYFVWINTPVANIDFTWEEYLKSLKPKRRYKVNSAYNTSGFSLTSLGTADEDVDRFVIQSYKHKYPDREEYEYALDQYYWVLACQEIGRAYWFWIEGPDGSKSLFYFMKKNDTLYFQGIAKSQDIPNLGAIGLSHIIKHCCDNSVCKVLDPVCKFVQEEDPIDIYKRVIVNKNSIKPLIYIIKGYEGDFITEGERVPYLSDTSICSLPVLLYKGV